MSLNRCSTKVWKLELRSTIFMGRFKQILQRKMIKILFFKIRTYNKETGSKLLFSFNSLKIRWFIFLNRFTKFRTSTTLRSIWPKFVCWKTKKNLVLKFRKNLECQFNKQVNQKIHCRSIIFKIQIYNRIVFNRIICNRIISNRLTVQGKAYHLLLVK